MSQGGYSGPPQSSGGGGTVIMIVLIVAGILVLGCLGICGLGFFGFTWGVNQVGKAASEAMPMIEQAMAEGFLMVQAQTAVMGNAEVREKLGEPLTFGTPENQLPQSGNSKTFQFHVSGPKGMGTVQVEAQRQGTDWKTTSLQVRLSDGSTIEVDASQSIQVPVDGDATPAPSPTITDPPAGSDPNSNVPPQ